MAHFKLLNMRERSVTVTQLLLNPDDWLGKMEADVLESGRPAEKYTVR